MDILSVLEAYSTDANQWLIQHQWSIVYAQVVLAIALCALVLRSYVRVYPSVRERIRKMPIEKRKETVKQIISDMICDGLEELKFDGLLTDGEVDTWYAKFARKFDLRDLIPMELPKSTLKKLIELRLKYAYRKKVLLPGDKPQDTGFSSGKL